MAVVPLVLPSLRVCVFGCSCPVLPFLCNKSERTFLNETYSCFKMGKEKREIRGNKKKTKPNQSPSMPLRDLLMPLKALPRP